MSSYRGKIAEAASDRIAPESGARVVELSGVVAHAGQPLIQGESQVFPFTIAGTEKIFMVSYNFSSAPKAPFIKRGMRVTVAFMETREPIVTCMAFDLPDIPLAEESPIQARKRDIEATKEE